jgi:hypothetical protein
MMPSSWRPRPAGSGVPGAQDGCRPVIQVRADQSALELVRVTRVSITAARVSRKSGSFHLIGEEGEGRSGTDAAESFPSIEWLISIS